MANSGKSKPSKPPSIDLLAHVRARLESVIAPADRLLLALSGGVDSVVLLDVLSRLASPMRFELEALHVNHQLSPHSEAWARFCRACCRACAVRCSVVKVEVARGNSVERAARDARYGALRARGTDWIVLAHNADDQAETVLLQLLRGTGVRGLAAMPLRTSGKLIQGRADEAPPLLRPLLDTHRADIEGHALARHLEWIEDESNADTSYTRNWLRRDVMPRIAERVPGYRATLARTAANLGEAALLLDELARIDSVNACVDPDGTLTVAVLRQLPYERAKNLLRFLISARGWRAPEADRLEEALRQTRTARACARVKVSLGDCELRGQGGVIHLLPSTPSLPATDSLHVVSWEGERTLRLSNLQGVLTMTPRRGSGLSLVRLRAGGPVTIRARAGGERLQPDPRRPSRTVKNLLQEARIPAWERERVPFIYSGDTLACVPGIAADHRFQACDREVSVVPAWRRD